MLSVNLSLMSCDMSRWLFSCANFHWRGGVAMDRVDAHGRLPTLQDSSCSDDDHAGDAVTQLLILTWWHTVWQQLRLRAWSSKEPQNQWPWARPDSAVNSSTERTDLVLPKYCGKAFRMWRAVIICTTRCYTSLPWCPSRRQQLILRSLVSAAWSCVQRLLSMASSMSSNHSLTLACLTAGIGRLSLVRFANWSVTCGMWQNVNGLKLADIFMAPVEVTWKTTISIVDTWNIFFRFRRAVNQLMKTSWSHKKALKSKASLYGQDQALMLPVNLDPFRKTAEMATQFDESATFFYVDIRVRNLLDRWSRISRVELLNSHDVVVLQPRRFFLPMKRQTWVKLAPYATQTPSSKPRCFW